jgi:hypothetical protein
MTDSDNLPNQFLRGEKSLGENNYFNLGEDEKKQLLSKLKVPKKIVQAATKSFGEVTTDEKKRTLAPELFTTDEKKRTLAPELFGAPSKKKRKKRANRFTVSDVCELKTFVETKKCRCICQSSGCRQDVELDTTKRGYKNRIYK